MANEIMVVSKEITDLQSKISTLSSTIPAALSPVNEAFASMAETIKSSFDGLVSGSASLSGQLLAIQGMGELINIAQLSEINTTLSQTKEILSSMWEEQQIDAFRLSIDSTSEAVGTFADGLSALALVKKGLSKETLESIGNFIAEKGAMALTTIATTAQEIATGTLTVAKQLLNAETWVSIGNWIKETAGTIADTVAKGAQNVAVAALTVTQKLFNAETWISIGNWIKETAGTIADTVAKGAQAVITGIVTAAQTALNLIMSMNPIALVIIAITALIAGFALLWNKCEGFRNFWIALFDIVKNIAISAFDLFKERFKSISEFVQNTIANVKQIFNGIVEFVKGVFSGDWKRAFEGLKDIFSGIFNQIKNVVKTPINFLIDGINMLLKGLNNIKFELPDWVPLIGGKGFGINIPLIPRLADGGLLSSGQMFIAREAGPELVGTYGSRTAVVNNDQIVESISRGVYEANSTQNALLREQNRLLRALLEKDTSISLDGKAITNTVERVQKERGLSLLGGSGVAYSY